MYYILALIYEFSSFYLKILNNTYHETGSTFREPYDTIKEMTLVFLNSLVDEKEYVNYVSTRNTIYWSMG